MSEADRADVFRGLSHPLRRRLLKRIGEGEASVSALLVGSKLTMPALSQHLRVLREAGLVSHRKEGHQRLYRRNMSTLRRARRWLEECE